MLQINCAGKPLDLSAPKIMGILNVTSDSFADGGRYQTQEAALQHALQMIADGAAIIDIGGESSRPGSEPVSLQQELDRVIPVLEKLRAETDAIISIDTCKPEVMRAAIQAGADMINDINALCDGAALNVVANSNVALCLMHMQGKPKSMQHNPHYENVVTEVKDYLQQRVNSCLAANIARDRIIIDPGFGFGKTTSHNLMLLKNLAEFRTLQLPILAGWSRKTSIGKILNCPPEDRLYGSLAAATIAILNGVNILRVHDVKPTQDILRFTIAMMLM